MKPATKPPHASWQLPLETITSITNAHPCLDHEDNSIRTLLDLVLRVEPGLENFALFLTKPSPPPTASLCNTNSKHPDQSYVPILKSSTAFYQTFVPLRLVSPSSSQYHCQIKRAEVPRLAHIFREGENSLHDVSMVTQCPTWKQRPSELPTWQMRETRG